MKAKVMLLGVGICFVVACALIVPYLVEKKPLQPPSSDSVERALLYSDKGGLGRAQQAGVGREPARANQQKHLHAALRILVDRAEYHAPVGLGLVDAGPLLALHTHDNSGVMHIHQPVQQAQPFTLKQWMQIWDKPYSATQFATWKLGKDKDQWRGRLWVDGKQRHFGDTVALENHTDIVVELVSPQVPFAKRAPSKFDWASAPIASEATPVP